MHIRSHFRNVDGCDARAHEFGRIDPIDSIRFMNLAPRRCEYHIQQLHFDAKLMPGQPWDYSCGEGWESMERKQGEKEEGREKPVKRWWPLLTSVTGNVVIKKRSSKGFWNWELRILRSMKVRKGMSQAGWFIYLTNILTSKPPWPQGSGDCVTIRIWCCCWWWWSGRVVCFWVCLDMQNAYYKMSKILYNSPYPKQKQAVLSFLKVVPHSLHFLTQSMPLNVISIESRPVYNWSPWTSMPNTGGSPCTWPV